MSILKKRNVLMMFADFSMGEMKEGERSLFTRHDYGIRRCHWGTEPHGVRCRNYFYARCTNNFF